MATILISGANSGIGKGFVTKYLSRPDTTVIGTVRDPNSAKAKALFDLPATTGSKLFLVKVDSTSETDAVEAIKSLGDKITKIDIVIANAAIFKLSAFKPVAEMQISDLMEHFAVNTAGPPILMVVTSGVASITAMEHIPFAISSYGASKASMNFLTRKIHFGHQDLIAFAVHPGAVKTDEGNAAARFFGFPEAATTVEDSVNGLVAKLDSATREGISGQFKSFDETLVAW